MSPRLKVVCSVKSCRRVYDTKPCLPEQDGLESHGYCPTCYPQVMAELRRDLDAMGIHEIGPDNFPDASALLRTNTAQAATPTLGTYEDAVNFNARKDLAGGVR